MSGDDIKAFGVPEGPLVGVALRAFNAANRQSDGEDTEKLRACLVACVREPEKNESAAFGELARLLIQERFDAAERQEPVRMDPAPLAVWGDHDEGTLRQINAAARLPMATAVALMPDGHLGYGLPIGGVLALEGAVCPYAVGVDIACRMKLSILDMPASNLARTREPFKEALLAGTRFGVGAAWEAAPEHAVLDDDWAVSPITRGMRDKASLQLGTSGTGNHFVEFGLVEMADGNGLGLQAGEYLALLSHSGSRGAGAAVCNHYSKIAAEKMPPAYRRDDDLRHLGWLMLDTAAGAEYWEAMNLMGRYAAANHAVIHERVCKALGVGVIAGVENHHNFAWKETHGDREVIVHRKGATPAGSGVYGVIPGSMADPGFIVRGKDGHGSLSSAAHGAGRRMSRNAARSSFTWGPWRDRLREADVTLLSAGIDEVPGAYKDIRTVMAQMSDLVEVVGRFQPKVVRMADDGKSED